MSKEKDKRRNVGFSATTLLSCARATAIKEIHPYYEDTKSAWNKFRGTLVHSMIEQFSPEREGVIRERRVVKYVTFDGVELMVTGQVDELDTTRELLVDYKSSHLIPYKKDRSRIKDGHEQQINIYCWLLAGGVWQDTGEPTNVVVRRAGMQYVSLETFIGGKKPVKVWPLQDAEELVLERLAPLAEWRRTGELPLCNAMHSYGNRLCDCVMLEMQLNEEGIYLDGQ